MCVSGVNAEMSLPAQVLAVEVEEEGILVADRGRPRLRTSLPWIWPVCQRCFVYRHGYRTEARPLCPQAVPISERGPAKSPMGRAVPNLGTHLSRL